METKIIKLHKTSVDELLEDIDKDFDEMYILGIKIIDDEQVIHWYTAGNDSRLKAVGVLEYLKYKSLVED